MAASILQRCLGSVKVIHKNGCLGYTARRWLLSAAYTDTALWEAREKDPQNLALLANFMDRLYDRNFPVSSLTMSRFVDNISSREEVDQAEYYLYKFRHSPNCWYLRDWTVHSWVRQCLKYGAKDKAMHTLKNKVQYGVFPDEFTFNLLIDSFIKDDDFKGACSVVEEVMLQESLERSSTQLLCLYAISRYLDTKPALGVEEQRALGAGLLIAGLKQQNSAGLSAQLMGCALLGKVELSQGVHALFRGMPLLWTPGYVARGLVVMETVSASSSADVRLSKDALDHMEAVLQEAGSEAESSGGEEESESSGGEEEEEKKEGREGEVLEEEHQAERARLPHYSSRFKELRAQLEVQARVDPSPLQAQVSGLVEEALAGAERSDLSRYQSRLEAWEADRKQLIVREAETREKAELEKRARLAAKAQRQQQQ